MIIVAQNCVIRSDAIKCITVGETEGHLIIEYVDNTITEAVFNSQAEALDALKSYINENTDAKVEWPAECVAPATEEEDE